MKLGLGLIQTAFSAAPTIDLELVSLAESLGYHSVWAAEAYGCDAVTSAAWLAAHTSEHPAILTISTVQERTRGAVPTGGGGQGQLHALRSAPPTVLLVLGN